jgi:hypothetical protein
MLAFARSSLLLGTALPLALLAAHPIAASAEVVVVNGADGANGATGSDTTPGGTRSSSSLTR